jgi:ribosomal protein L7/L12
MKDGSVVPLTVGYRPDADDAIVKIADRIRTLLGHNAEATAQQDLEDLIATGRTIEAIRIVRERDGLSLTDAKQRVEEIRRKAASR